MAGSNPSIGQGFMDVTISIPLVVAGHASHADAIRHALQLTLNLESLVLDVAESGPDDLMDELSFPQLAVFSTNLPHRVFAPFLHLHPFIKTLVLRSCEGRLCPVRIPTLPHLASIHCPSGCLVVSCQQQPEMIQLPLPPKSSLHNPPAAFLRLCTLSIEFSPDDHDILARIVAVAPSIQQLKLNERSDPRVCFRALSHVRKSASTTSTACV